MTIGLDFIMISFPQHIQNYRNQLNATNVCNLSKLRIENRPLNDRMLIPAKG